MFRRLTKDEIDFVSSVDIPTQHVNKRKKSNPIPKKDECSFFLPRELLLKDISAQKIVAYSKVDKEKVYSAFVRVVTVCSSSKSDTHIQKNPKTSQSPYFCKACKKENVVGDYERSGMLVCFSCGVEVGPSSSRLHSYVDGEHVVVEDEMKKKKDVRNDSIMDVFYQVSGPHLSADMDFLMSIANHYTSLGHHLSEAAAVAILLYVNHYESIKRCGRLSREIESVCSCDTCGDIFYRKIDRRFHKCASKEEGTIRRRVMRNDLSVHE